MPSSGRKALVVFTDGEDQGSRARIEDVEQSLQSSDVTLVHDRSRPRHLARCDEDRHAAAGRTNRRPRTVHRRHRRAAQRLRRTARRTVEPVPARLRADECQTRRRAAHDQGAGGRLFDGPRAQVVPLLAGSNEAGIVPLDRGAGRLRHSRGAGYDPALPIRRRRPADRHHCGRRQRPADPRSGGRRFQGISRRRHAPGAERGMDLADARRGAAARARARRLQLQRKRHRRAADRPGDRSAQHPVRRRPRHRRRDERIHRSADRLRSPRPGRNRARNHIDSIHGGSRAHQGRDRTADRPDAGAGAIADDERADDADHCDAVDAGRPGPFGANGRELSLDRPQRSGHL